MLNYDHVVMIMSNYDHVMISYVHLNIEHSTTFEHLNIVQHLNIVKLSGYNISDLSKTF